MEIRELVFGTTEYSASLELRDLILRRPLGMTNQFENHESEVHDFHVAAFEDGVLVGILVLTKLENSELKMRQVAVHIEFQGRGIGAQLVIFSEGLARKEGFKTMVLNARKPVVEFYKKLGYETEGEEFIEVTIPHFKMIKVL